jgi:hypothetical protein
MGTAATKAEVEEAEADLNVYYVESKNIVAKPIHKNVESVYDLLEVILLEHV